MNDANKLGRLGDCIGWRGGISRLKWSALLGRICGAFKLVKEEVLGSGNFVPCSEDDDAEKLLAVEHEYRGRWMERVLASFFDAEHPMPKPAAGVLYKRKPGPK